MEKQILTREQAEALNEIFEKAAFTKDELIDLYAETGLYRSLRELSVSELAKALYIGYEVEPEFKVGDWVYNEKAGTVARVGERYDGGEWVWVDDEEFTFYSVNDTRHATPEEIEKEKERRWWAKHGRDVWELRKGDLLLDNYLKVVEVTAINDSKTGISVNGHSHYGMSHIKELYKIVCFAEDRKDVEDND